MIDLVLKEFGSSPISTIFNLFGMLSATWLLIINFYKKFYKGYLLYEIRKFELQEGEVFEVLCIWNPTKKDIKKEEITKDFKSISNVISVTQLVTTNKILKELISQNDNKAELFFENFPAKSGCVYALRFRGVFSSSSYLMSSGKVNNEEIRSFRRMVHDTLLIGLIYDVLACIIMTFLIQIFVGLSIFCVLPLFYVVASFFYRLITLKILKKPKPLVDSFDGSNYL